MFSLCSDDASLCYASYQDDFFTPGTRPSLASSLKQIRHISNLLMYPGLLPQSLHLLYIFVGNVTFAPAAF